MAKKRKKKNNSRLNPFPTPTFPLYSQRNQSAVGGISSKPFEFRNNFANSLKSKQINADILKELAQNVLFDRAIERISNGVANLPWILDPPEEQKDSDEVIKKARYITRALKQPNNDHRHNTYRKLTKSLIRDMLIFGSAAIERQLGNPNPPSKTSSSQKPGEQEKAFWLWSSRPEYIKINIYWDGDLDEPRYWYAPTGYKPDDWEPLLDEDLFLLQSRVSSYELVSPSPIRLAYEDICIWMGLHNYQGSTVKNAVRDYMIALEDANQNEVDNFREFWSNNVVGLGQIPIIGGKVNVVKTGAKTDEELYLKFTEYITGVIALYFGLSQRDLNNQHEESYATANVAQSHSFQDAILPIALMYVEELNNQVVDYYYPGYQLQIADAEPSKEIEEAQRATTLYREGVITKNEARRMVGEDPVIGGDEFASSNQGNPGQPEQTNLPEKNQNQLPAQQQKNNQLPKANSVEKDKKTVTQNENQK